VKRYPEHFIKQARRLVAGGLSGAEVAKILNIHSGLISNWCRDVPKSRFLGLIRYNQKKRNIYLNSDKRMVDKFILDKDNAKLLCGLLYGCEGSKYPANNGVAFVNSDPKLVITFVSLLRKSYLLDESKWRVHLQIHSNQNYDDLKKYWSDLLLIPE
jgi:hypothetical protein